MLLVGVMLLVTAIPHRDPWNMSLVGVQADRGQVTVNFPIVEPAIYSL